MKTVLTIAGSDTIGGAGIQADIKTITMNGAYAMSVITALTAQNTMGVIDVLDVNPKFLKKQIDAVFEDIYPDAVKIGMVSSVELINVIVQRLKYYNVKNIVLDPVMVATSGAKLIKTDAVSALLEKLFPIATIITPNIPEAEVISGVYINDEKDMIKAARLINERYNCAVLCKGGHSINEANDLLFANEKYKWFRSGRIDNPNTHGTGCTLSSAIAANLAKGLELDDAIRMSKKYISGALADMLNLGRGSGPLNHAFDLNGYFA